MQWNGASSFESEGKSMETEQQCDQNFPMEGRLCRTNTSIRR